MIQEIPASLHRPSQGPVRRELARIPRGIEASRDWPRATIAGRVEYLTRRKAPVPNF